MSRISRYQESINKFLKNKSCLCELDDAIKNNIIDIINDFDHIAGIIFLTIINNKGKKDGISLHGYYMASGVDMMELITKISSDKKYYNGKYGEKNINLIMTQLIGLINICLANNVETIQPHFQSEKILKIYNNTSKILNINLIRMINENDKNYKFDGMIRTTDILKYHFTKFDEETTKQKLSKLKKIEINYLLNIIYEKYGIICQTSLILGWLLGGGEEKCIKKLEKIGLCLSVLMKVTYDINNLEHDLEIADTYSLNLVINNGLQNTLELYLVNKQKFIEGCMILNIYTHTIQEVIALMENKIDVVIDKTSPDMTSHYTIDSQKTSTPSATT